jgi:rSAM/selenodomain-associated transferase 1
MKAKNFLGFFAKFPEPGKVKTRLAREIGVENAASFYRHVAEYVLKRTAPAGSGYRRIVFYTPEELRQRFRDWLQDEELRVQRGADVGERMAHALAEMFALGAEKALVVGADIPGLHRGIIDCAFRHLDTADVVLGPALDGGYYLIGMKAPHREIFADVPWGTGEVWQKTLFNIKKKGLRYRSVATLFDVDVLEDYRKAKEIMENAGY